ncbi:MAG: single-stranded-DNA-specific exonuclease RecJ [Candidatus Omnitrophica bacterium]|nr:single-stranded-DNA-specific exonuclease RecJ [Candidatus Omnitrophota bacterium]
MKNWKVAEETSEVKKLAEETGLSLSVCQLLVNRNVKDKEESQKFLYPKRKFIHEPSLLPDLEEAVLRIRKAIDNKEKILLFGDYDVDGITSLAMLSDYFSKRGVDFFVLIPSRIDDGYGFNKKAFAKAIQEGATLIIALDCGTNSRLLNEAKSLGLDVVVVDHHESFKMKRNFLLVNPKRQDSIYPFKEVSTGALTFKLIWALKGIFAYEYLDLVSLSIVCDVAPLLDENRILVKLGLEKLRTSPCLGIESLIKKTTLKSEYIDTFHLGWILGPRLNASGRISCAYPAFELLSSDCEQRASELAIVLEKNNKQRRQESKEVLNSALAKIESEVDLRKDYVIVLFEEDWHSGILGIAASNIKERFSRPTFLISLKENLGKGSGRSIDNFHLMQALDECRDYLKDYGGHKKACGIEIEKDKINKFREAINEVAKKVLKEKDLISSLEIDRQINFSEITPQFLETLKLFSPFGEANPEPLFLTKSLKVKNITDKGTDKFVWFQEQAGGDANFIYPARIGANNKFFRILEYGQCFDVVYSLKIRSNQPDSQAVLSLKDVRMS